MRVVLKRSVKEKIDLAILEHGSDVEYIQLSKIEYINLLEELDVSSRIAVDGLNRIYKKVQLVVT